MDDAAETKNEAESEDEECHSNCLYLKMPTMLEESPEDAGWYKAEPEEHLNFCL